MEKWILLWCALFCVIYGAEFQPGDMVYSLRFSSVSDLDAWSPSHPTWATLVDGLDGNKALNITVPSATGNDRPVSRMITTSFNATRFSGYNLQVVVKLKAINVSQPLQAYNGIKGMLSFKTSSGATSYSNANGFYGDLDWSNSYAYLVPLANDCVSGSFALGLQDSSGTILIDSIVMYVFRIPISPLPTPPVNPPAPFTGHEGVPAFRGVMSPQTYVDSQIENLGKNWKANVIRWQLAITSTDASIKTDLVKYDAWLHAKLNETDYLLNACIKYGIKVVVDLHSPPGGRDPVYGDRFLINQTYQDHFFEIWKNISARYKGHKAVWGYDIDNEPYQLLPGNPGVLQWQEVAEKTTQIIRAIDPDTPLLISGEIGGDPSAFKTLRPVSDDKVIYQFHMYVPGQYTHQGILFPFGLVYPGIILGEMYNITKLKQIVQPVRDFQLAFNVQIYVGEFSAARWAANATAVNYLRDCILIFEEYGWDWSYHAYKEYQGWSVEYDEDINSTLPVNTTLRKELLLHYFSLNVDPYTVPTSSPSSSPSPSPSPSSSPSPSPSPSSPDDSSASRFFLLGAFYLSLFVVALII